MKKNNGGFSLVEMIIVVAIMAVLIAVLAPQYITYVEKTKATTDAQSFGEVIKATQYAIADPENKINNGTINIEWDGAKYTVTGDSESTLQSLVNIAIHGKSDDNTLVASSQRFASGDTVTISKTSTGNWNVVPTAGGPYEKIVFNK